MRFTEPNRRAPYAVAVAISMAVGALCAPASADAQPASDAQCRPDDAPQDALRYWRSLRLDLTGQPPTFEEYEAIRAEGEVSPARIRALLESEGFVDRVQRHHRALLWNNIENVDLYSFRTFLARSRRGGEVYWLPSRSERYRGARVPCRDEPATFDDRGRPVTVEEDGARREGWVEVEPYWAPGETIEVCAFDAQARAVSSRGTDCSGGGAFRDPGCGCGPDLMWCRAGANRAVHRAFAEDVERRIGRIIREGRPYTEIFTSNVAFVNGPASFYLRNQRGLTQGVSFEPVPYREELLPDLDYTDVDTWVEIQLPDGHAGVLTSPAFLLRFQTNRARANRFYDSFLCQPFTPPPGGLPVADPEALAQPDLQKRDGCKYCHAILEPAAAHWGRWAQQGAGFLDPADYPAFRADCEACAQSGERCSRACRENYITRPLTTAEEAYVGQLYAYQFLKPEHFDHVEAGPRLLVQQAVVDDRFSGCVAQRAAESLLGRPLTEGERTQVDAWSRAFTQSGFDYRALVEAVVTSDVYRRVQ
jgi:hypothetical protein